MLTRVHLVRVRAGARARARVGVKVSLVEVRRVDLGFRAVRPGASSSTAHTGYAHRPPAYRTCLRRRAACPGGPLLCVRRARTSLGRTVRTYTVYRVVHRVFAHGQADLRRPAAPSPAANPCLPLHHHCACVVRVPGPRPRANVRTACRGTPGRVRAYPPARACPHPSYRGTTTGKTTILYKLQMGEVVTTVPTIGLPHRARTSDQQTLGGPATHTSEPQVC